jgi:hypothetical protein
MALSMWNSSLCMLKAITLTGLLNVFTSFDKGKTIAVMLSAVLGFIN